MFEGLISIIVAGFTFFVVAFVWVFDKVYFILMLFYGLTKLHFFKRYFINFLYKTLLLPAYYKLMFLIKFVLSAVFIAPFVVLESILNVLSFCFLNVLSVLFYSLQMFFNLIVYSFSEYFTVLLLPEVLILLAAILALLISVRARFVYTNDRFFNELAAVFGKQAVESISVGSYEYTVLLRFHNAKKRLTALFQAWWVAFFLMLVSFVWLLASTYEIFSVKLFGFGAAESVKSGGLVGLNDLFFGNSFYHDGFSQSVRIFILFISIVFMLLLRFEIQNDSRLRRIEFLFLFLVGSALSMLMVASSNLLTLFLSVEGLVMVMYVLTAGSSIQSGFPIVKILRFRAVEGALKYAITNAVATGFFLFGVVLIFFFSGGELHFLPLHGILKTASVAGSGFISYGLLIGSALVALTFLFKLGAVPFHNWMADLYEASVPGVLTYFLLIPKAAILFTFLNLNRFIFSAFDDFFIFLFFFVGLLSTVVGSVHALYQLKIERLLAYSSVAHAGGFLLLLSAVSFSADRPFQLVIFFVIAYIFVNALFLSVYLSLRYSSSFFSHSYIKSFKLFSNLTPSAQKVVSTIFFNLAGLPPFLGWFLKALVLIVWVKACFFVRSEGFIVGSGFGSLFDFSSNLSVADHSVGFFVSFQDTVALWFVEILEKFVGWIGWSINSVVLFEFSRNFIALFFALLVLFLFLIMVVSTFYYVRLVNTMYGGSTNSPLVFDKQGLLHPLSLDVALLVLLLFFFNIFFLFFFSSVISFIDLFFVKFSLGF